MRRHSTFSPPLNTSENSVHKDEMMRSSQRDASEIDKFMSKSSNSKREQDEALGELRKDPNFMKESVMTAKTNEKDLTNNVISSDFEGSSAYSQSKSMLLEMKTFPRKSWNNQYVTTKHRDLVGKVVEVIDDHHVRVNVVQSFSKTGDVSTTQRVFEISTLLVLDLARIQSLDDLHIIFFKSAINVMMLYQMLSIEHSHTNDETIKAKSNGLSSSILTNNLIPSTRSHEETTVRVIYPVPYELSHIPREKWINQIVTTQRRKILGKVKSIVNDSHVIVKLIQSSSTANSEQCFQISQLEVLDKHSLSSKEYIRYIFKDMTPFQHLLKGSGDDSGHNATNRDIHVSQVKQYEGMADKSASSRPDIKADKIVSAVADMVSARDEDSSRTADQKEAKSQTLVPTIQLLTELSKDIWIDQIVTTKRRKFVGKVTKVIDADHVILSILVSHNGNDRSVYLKTQLLEVIDKSQISSVEHIKAIFTGSPLNIDELFNKLRGSINAQSIGISQTQSLLNHASTYDKESDQDIWNRHLYSNQFPAVSPTNGPTDSFEMEYQENSSHTCVSAYPMTATRGSNSLTYNKEPRELSVEQLYSSSDHMHSPRSHQIQSSIRDVCEKYLRVGVIDDSQLN